MVVMLGAMAVKVKSIGVVQAIKRIGAMQAKFGTMVKKVKPQLKTLQTGFTKFGAAAGLAMGMLIRASPRLRAQFEILNLRVNSLLRTFGDELAPVIEIVTDLVKGLTEWFESLPEPVQEAIKFGTTLAIVVGILAGAFAALSLAASPVTLSILAIAAAAALLYLAFQTNFGGFRDVVENVFAKVKPLFESITNLLSLIGGTSGETSKEFSDAFGVIEKVATAVFGTLGTLAEGWITQLQGIVDFITAIFKGDLEGALEGVLTTVTGIFEAMGAIILGPLNFLRGLIEGLTGSDILGDMIKAGQELIGAFLEGALAAIEDAGQLVQDVLDWLGEFFGGSLPEKGPLKDIDKMGQELGEAYVINIGTGVERTAAAGAVTTFAIDNLNLELPETSLASKKDFFGGLGTGVRRSTRY